MPLTPFPPAPSRAAPLEFADRADAWLAHFENPFVPEFNAAQTDINTKQQQSTSAATQATQASSAAAESAAQSLAFSQAAAISANVTPWQSGVSYTAGQTVFSQIDFHTYRARTNHTSGTDPFFDPTNWQKLTGVDVADYGFINTAPTTLVDYGAL